MADRLADSYADRITTAIPVARCHSMWQWKNQKPGLFSFHWMTACPPAWTLTVSFTQGAFAFNGPSL